MTSPAQSAVVLLAASPRHPIVATLGSDYRLVHVHSGGQALLALGGESPADLIVLEATLPDTTGNDLCRILRDDMRIPMSVPVLILTPDRPTPDQRVAALSAGAWDCIGCRDATDAAEVDLKLQAYVQAKRKFDQTLSDSFVDPVSRLHTRPGLARRARELGALMVRQRGALACVAFEFNDGWVAAREGQTLVHTVRTSDVVGVLGHSAYAVLAPGTDVEGAVQLARRVASAAQAGWTAAAPAMRAGFDAVANFKYAPTDPVTLLIHAASAVQNGRPEPGAPWLRRFDAAAGSTTAVPIEGILS